MSPTRHLLEVMPQGLGFLSSIVARSTISAEWMRSRSYGKDCDCPNGLFDIDSEQLGQNATAFRAQAHIASDSAV